MSPVRVQPRQLRQRGERGDAAILWCLLAACLLLPMAGISVDLWHAVAVQRQLQAAAEDAATAGASGIDTELYRATGCIALAPVLAAALARADLARQSGLGALSAVDVVVPANGDQVTVTLREPVRLTLMRIVEGGRAIVVAASAVGRPRGTVGGGTCPG